MNKLYKDNLHISNQNKVSDKLLRTRMLTSFLCIMVCMLAMISSAYAWFQMEVTSGGNELNGANYSLIVTASNAETCSAFEDVEDGRYVYECGLVNEDKHYFTFEAIGTASTGYCKIIISEINDGEESCETYYTKQIAQGNSLEVCIQAAQGCTIEFVPTWGTCETQTTFSLRTQDMFAIRHSTTPYVKYKVVEGVTLEDLADYYGVTVEDICIYNDITELTVGDIIKIPGVEDDAIEPYKPPVKEVATPSNAVKGNAGTGSSGSTKSTPSNATEKTEKASSSNTSASK